MSHPYVEESARVLPASPLQRAKVLVKGQAATDAPPKKPSATGESLLLAILGGSAAGDVGTTIAGLKKGYGEANPLMRPFANKGALPLALAAGGLTALTGWSAHELKKRGSKVWWVPPVLSAALHGYAIHQNLKTMKR